MHYDLRESQARDACNKINVSGTYSIWTYHRSLDAAWYGFNDKLVLINTLSGSHVRSRQQTSQGQLT
jgi:hypothetical protein